MITVLLSCNFLSCKPNVPAAGRRGGPGCRCCCWRSSAEWRSPCCPCCRNPWNEWSNELMICELCSEYMNWEIMNQFIMNELTLSVRRSRRCWPRPQRCRFRRRRRRWGPCWISWCRPAVGEVEYQTWNVNIVCLQFGAGFQKSGSWTWLILLTRIHDYTQDGL